MGSQNCVINAHEKILMSGKQTTDLIADFEVLANELKSLNFMLLYYKVTSEYFSGEAVKEILDRHLSKNTCKEFTSFMNSKSL